MNVYYIDLDTTDFDLKNQLTLEAEVKYALATEHTHLLDCNGKLFEIYVEGDEIILNECEIEECCDCCDDKDCSETEPDEDDPSQRSSSEIIDLIITNSLLSNEPIRKEQAETMLILAQLKNTLAAK